MLVSDTIIWAGTFILAVYFTDSAFDHNPFAPLAEQSEPIGYATLLTWIRATGFMTISGICWSLLGFETSVLNNCDFSFSVCYTTATFATTTASLTIDPLSKSVTYLFYGLGFMNIIISVVMFVWLALPNDQTKRLRTLFGVKQGQV
jgi:hypothetical protein